jgi:hypothetical protein
VIDNNQTTWPQFGCFVAQANTFVCGYGGRTTAPFCSTLASFSAAIDQIGRACAAGGSLLGTKLAET